MRTTWPSLQGSRGLQNPLTTLPGSWFGSRVNIWWEIRRERFIKIEMIKQKQREAVAQNRTNASRFLFGKSGLQRECYVMRTMSPACSGKKVLEPVQKNQEDPMTSLARVLEDDPSGIEGCDRRIAALEFRGSAVLRDVERRNQVVARDAEKATSDILDAEFTEALD